MPWPPWSGRAHRLGQCTCPSWRPVLECVQWSRGAILIQLTIVYRAIVQPLLQRTAPKGGSVSSPQRQRGRLPPFSRARKAG
jgi:hypothetical protein